jgi:hypothetical protein
MAAFRQAYLGVERLLMSREEPLADVGVAHRLGSVGVWRGGSRGGLSVAYPFVRRLARHFKCGISFGERPGAATAYLYR